MPLEEENYISAAGTTRGELVRASVDAETDVQDPEKFAEIVVRQEGDKRVRLGDVAEVELASDTYESAAYSSGRGNGVHRDHRSTRCQPSRSGRAGKKQSKGNRNTTSSRHDYFSGLGSIDIYSRGA